MTGVAPSVIYLPGVEIDVPGERVRAGEIESRLRHKTFEVLMFLIENRNRVVSKGELFESIWGGLAVTEDTLVQSIVEIRKALGDDPRSPRFVRTIPRTGYQFIAPVETSALEIRSSDVMKASDISAALAPSSRFELEETRSVEVAVEEIDDDWRRFIPHLAIAVVIVALGLIAALWLNGRRLAQTAIPAPGSPLANRMTDSLEAYEEYRLGVAAADGYDNNKALAHFQRAIALDPSFAMAHARIGYTYAVTWNLPDKARPHFERALSSGARLTDRERLYVLGWQAIGHRDYTKAIDHFRLILSRYPTDVEAYGRLGKLLIGEERLDEAIDVLRRGLPVDPDEAQLNNSLGTAYSYRGQHAEAIKHHLRYVESAPREANAHDSLGLSYNWAGEYEKALGAYAEALRLKPGFEVATIHQAGTYWQLGRIREAIADIQRYIALTASSPSSERSRGYIELSILYRNLGQVEREAEAVLEGSRNNPDSVLVEILLAIDRGETKTAAALAESLRRSPATARGARVSVRLGTYVRAEAARAAGDESRALEYAREAVRHAPPIYLVDDMEDVFGDTLAAFGRHQEAIDEYQRILKMNSRRARTRFKMARSLEVIGRSDEARDEYRRFVIAWSNADSDVPELVAARKRLR